MAHSPEIEIRLTEVSQQRTLARIAGATLPIGVELIAFLRELYGLSGPGAAQLPQVETPQPSEANKPDQWTSIPGRVDFDAKGNPITPERGRPADDYFKYYYLAQKLKIPVDRLEFYKLTPYNDADTFSARNAEWKRRNKLQRDNRGRKAVKKL
jgi:hypothetical protein